MLAAGVATSGLSQRVRKGSSLRFQEPALFRYGDGRFDSFPSPPTRDFRVTTRRRNQRVGSWALVSRQAATEAPWKGCDARPAYQAIEPPDLIDAKTLVDEAHRGKKKRPKIAERPRQSRRLNELRARCIRISCARTA